MLFCLFHRNNQTSFKHKTFSSTGFENKSYFFSAKMVALQYSSIPNNYTVSLDLTLRKLSSNFLQFHLLEDNYYSDILFPLFVRNNHQVLRNIKLPVALGLKEKVIFWRKNGSIFEAQNPSKSPKLQLNIICH